MKIRLRYILAAVLTAGCLYLISTLMNREKVLVVQENGSDQVRITQTGDPVFPFGEVPCCFRLYEDGRECAVHREELANDGKIPDASQFTVVWQDGGADVICQMEEETFTVQLRKQ